MIARRLTKTERAALNLPAGEYFTVDPIVLAMAWRDFQYGRVWTSDARWN